MRFASMRAVWISALAVIVLGPTSSVGMKPQPPSEGGGRVQSATVPLGVSSRPITVMVQVAGDSVAVQQGNAGRRFSRDEKQRAKAQLKSRQDALRGGIQNLGGSVVADYQASYNGMKVRISARNAEKLATLPGVTAVRPLQRMSRNNTLGVPLVGAPALWQSSALRGEGIKIAIIDSGIDYTHANFGGPGTPAAYDAAHASEASPANPALFGPMAPRVKGGIDLVGDAYNADLDTPPMPDPNPLDCDANGHGSHVAGSAAGSGVLANGTSFGGPYDANTISTRSWLVGPGVAPRADLYAVRVFGCAGSTALVVDAIEWAVDNDMDVINMSLGSDFGSGEEPSAAAATNAAKAGIIVVASAGNSGAIPYVTGSPAASDGAISVAALQPVPSFPTATISIPASPLFPAGAITAIVANGFPLPGPASYTVKYTNNLGCSVADFGGPLPPNTLAVVNRGVCARVAKAIFGQQAGAAAVAMINTSNTLPPFEGAITSNPDDGVPFTVTIPFFGVRGPVTSNTDGRRLAAANTLGVGAVAGAPIPNPAFLVASSFSSAGPRMDDSNLKPDVIAPGENIVSTLVGTGNAGAAFSGTSMASPHVAGLAALTRQAHPTWKVQDIKSAIVNTALASNTAFQPSRRGVGLPQAPQAARTHVVARPDGDKFDVAINFGFEELKSDFTKSKEITLRNKGPSTATFNVSQVGAMGQPHTLSFSRTSIRVPAHGDADVRVTLKVPAATAGLWDTFTEVGGLVEFTPASASDNGGVGLRVPYYMAPTGRADIETDIGKLKGPNASTIATVTNKHASIGGEADFYAWGLQDGKTKGKVSNDIRAVGTQSFDLGPDKVLVFAVNTWDRWSNPAVNEFDIFVDVNGDGVDDYAIFNVDFGLLVTGGETRDGQIVAATFDLVTGAIFVDFLAVAPMNGSTILMPVTVASLCQRAAACLSAANPRISYGIVGFDLLNGGVDEVAGRAKFNPFASSISNGAFVPIGPKATDKSTIISVNSAEWAVTPALGLMVVSLGNESGAGEAQLIKVKAQGFDE